MQFRYQAIDKSGHAVSGVVDGRSEREASRQLAQQGLTTLSLAEQGEQGARRRRGKASSRELQLVLQEFTTLLEAGVSLVTALSSLAKSSHHPQITGVFSGMEKAVRRGDSFAQARSIWPRMAEPGCAASRLSCSARIAEAPRKVARGSVTTKVGIAFT